jgi:hypothetical protein
MLRVHTISVIGAVALALAVPAAAGAQQDLRSPDAGGSAIVFPSADPQAAETSANDAVTATSADLRSPDVRDAAAQAGTDLRSPDARDASANTAAAVSAAAAAPTAAQAPAPVIQESSTGFEWGDAGIGAAGMLALVLLAVGAGLLAVRHRHGHGHGMTPTH